MGCCGEKTGPEPRNRRNSRYYSDEEEDFEDEFQGPTKKRSCTDILCFILFVAFIGFMIYLFGYAFYKGNAYRIIRGYDVGGNICGRQNDRLDNISFSGQNMEEFSYLYFDILLSVQLLGGQELVKAAEITGETLEDKSGLENPREVCISGSPAFSNLPGAATSTESNSSASNNNDNTNSSRLWDDEQEQIILKNLLVKYDAVELQRTRTRQGKSMVALLTGNGKIEVFLLENEEKDSEVRQEDDEFNSRKLLSESVTVEEVTKLLSSDLISESLKGGGTCRYCVEKCPDGWVPFLSRCFPEFVNSTSRSVYKSVFGSATGLKDFLSDAISDIRISWLEILYMALIGLAFSIVTTILFRFLAGFIVYFVLILAILACISGTSFLWVIWHYRKKSYDEYKANNFQPTSNDTEEMSILKRLKTADSESDVRNFLIAAIFATIITVILIVIIVAIRKRIKLVIQLFKEAGKAVHSMPLIILQPFWTLAALFVAVVLWTAGLIYLESSGNPKEHASTGFVTFEKTTFVLYMRWLYLFGLLWITQFIIACQHMTIAGAVASWYFSKTKNSLGWPIAQSLWRLVRYHIGSAAFGSLLIALIKLIRAIMHYLTKQVRNNGGAVAKPLVCCLKICQCCLWCFEKTLQYLNRNAYIEIASFGHNFCKACQRAFKILVSNMVRVAALNSVGTFILFISKIAIVICTILIGEIIIKNKDVENSGDEIIYEWIPVAMGGICAYIIADAFVEVYGMTVDTIFICFCEDSEMNDGMRRPYFMSRGLMEFVNNSDKALALEEERRRVKNGQESWDPETYLQ